jgi:Putative Na+/H+ antiporter
MISVPDGITFPTPLSAYPPPSSEGLLATLSERIAVVPFNAVATAIFVLAILHTFAAAKFAHLAHQIQERHDARLRAARLPAHPSVAAEMLHFFGEVEVVFGLWAVVLTVAMLASVGWDTTRHYLNDTVNYTEPLFVVVIMALASTRPIINLAESGMRLVANLGGATPGAWWLAILIVGPLLGSFITEPAAMTICALLLSRQFFDLNPSRRLKYATLGLLFVNVSVGGTLTHFAAPPVLMVARSWGWDTPYMLGHFGWRAVVAVTGSTILYYAIFRREMRVLSTRRPVPDIEEPEVDTVCGAAPLLPVPVWLTVAHVLFMAWTVMNSHYPGLFLAGFLFFIGLARATAPYQSQIDLKSPMLVGFFLAGLVIHGGLQGWWIAPVLASLSETPLYFGATVLTAFNDNALITYLATLVPTLTDSMKGAVVEGAVTGGGLTVIANAPNPAGQALLGKFFGDAVEPLWLAGSALLPTLITIVAFRLV